jgi:hypothetical protein
MTGPTATREHMPFKGHRTVAEVDADEKRLTLADHLHRELREGQRA